MKAKESFLDRNKRKSVLALLLLLLRQHKVLVLLLFVVLFASTMFLTPSSWITSFPGGTRFVAGVAWIAEKMGIDVSRWGLGPGGRQSYTELLAAFRAAKEGAGNGGVGWGPFFGAGGSGASGGDRSSLDYVQGKQSDLDGGKGSGKGGIAAIGGNQTIQGVVDPADSKNKGATPVALGDGDLGGERQAFAGGFFSGIFGSGAGSASGASSSASMKGGAASAGGASAAGAGAMTAGGAYAGKGFFSGSGSAAGAQPGDLARSGLSGVGIPKVPPSKTGGAAKGSLNAISARAVDARAAQGFAGASDLGTQNSFAQLAEGSARAQLGVQSCVPPSCPPEYAATNTGAIYDGNSITQGFLTSSDPGGNSAGLISPSVVVPPGSTTSGPGDTGGTGGTTGDPGALAKCEQTLNACESGKVSAQQHLTDIQQQMNSLMSQMPGACGNPCNCDPCNNLSNQINNICQSKDTNDTIATVYGSCNLPASCNTMGIADPSLSDAGAQNDMCKLNYGSCHPPGFFGSIMCALGS